MNLGCGVCNVEVGNCTADTDCTSGNICEPIQCSCTNAKQCVPGCGSMCAEGTVCDNGTHPRCVPSSCSANQPCQPSFECVGGTCARKSCSGADAGAADAECDPAGQSFCVEGSCYSGLGMCFEAVP